MYLRKTQALLYCPLSLSPEKKDIKNIVTDIVSEIKGKLKKEIITEVITEVKDTLTKELSTTVSTQMKNEFMKEIDGKS